jgi:hypothetical protein
MQPGTGLLANVHREMLHHPLQPVPNRSSLGACTHFYITRIYPSSHAACSHPPSTSTGSGDADAYTFASAIGCPRPGTRGPCGRCGCSSKACFQISSPKMRMCRSGPPSPPRHQSLNPSQRCLFLPWHRSRSRHRQRRLNVVTVARLDRIPGATVAPGCAHRRTPLPLLPPPLGALRSLSLRARTRR